MAADADTGTDTWIGYVESLRHVYHVESPAEFCKRIGIGAATYSRWTKGQGSVSPATALAISREFGISLKEVQIAAGFGTAEDYGIQPGYESPVWQLSRVTNKQLLELLESRMKPDPELKDPDPTRPPAPPAPDVKRGKTRDDN